MVNSDPRRTPTFTGFADPNYFLTSSNFAPSCGSNPCIDYHFAWSHGDIQPQIGTTWVGFVGPGIAHGGVDSSTWTDHTNVRPTYAYYRFRLGVATGGSPLTDAERTSLFDAAGLGDSEKRVMMAISKLEGSFDAVNTYDTGYVSVGFIQFITFDDGRHSLAQVLSREKADAPADFERDFRRFGIDLTADHILTVVDPAMGAELTQHLGYEKHTPEGRGSGNSRNGVSRKKVQGDFGAVEGSAQLAYLPKPLHPALRR